MSTRALGLSGSLAVLLLISCTTTRQARLYNVETGQVLYMEFTDSAAAGGQITVSLPSGEVLKGEYTVMRGGSVEWGSIYALGETTPAATATSRRMERLNQGTAIATGSQGTVLECEFLADSLAGNAQGTCRDNKGNTYRMVA